ncbi:hypothetical protein Pla175_41710 [Pirellulimonas nuda]|uniref:Uncharacterized protein n=1 Tax=Pirellulimonas nuda TaxID=2528009 RepID=A0A518DH06_9BACT|nr:hypothetical protein [Pirellulimonas nuda]QDU90759.1 hypothetical protein Pla175_41710 [Pirellulimonas nuda]
MASRWEHATLAYVVQHIDPAAVGGKAIRSVGLDPRLFDGKPESHGAAAHELRGVYELLAKSARDAGRLAEGEPLVRQWALAWDVYSPKLKRFIEVDEHQHFSRPRLGRLEANRTAPWAPVYSAYFWEETFPRLVDKPKHDQDPPHRDEQRAYRDELRDRLPALYGLGQTIRIDEFTLKADGQESLSQLIAQADNHTESGPVSGWGRSR